MNIINSKNFLGCLIFFYAIILIFRAIFQCSFDDAHIVITGLIAMVGIGIYFCFDYFVEVDRNSNMMLHEWILTCAYTLTFPLSFLSVYGLKHLPGFWLFLNCISILFVLIALIIAVVVHLYTFIRVQYEWTDFVLNSLILYVIWGGFFAMCYSSTNSIHGNIPILKVQSNYIDGTKNIRPIAEISLLPQNEDSITDPTDYYYFSYVTIATTGYGDLSPKSSIGKVITILENIVGLFLTGVMLSGAVGIIIKDEDKSVDAVSLGFIKKPTWLDRLKSVFIKAINRSITKRGD